MSRLLIFLPPLWNHSRKIQPCLPSWPFEASLFYQIPTRLHLPWLCVVFDEGQWHIPGSRFPKNIWQLYMTINKACIDIFLTFFGFLSYPVCISNSISFSQSFLNQFFSVLENPKNNFAMKLKLIICKWNLKYYTSSFDIVSRLISFNLITTVWILQIFWHSLILLFCLAIFL